MTKRMTLDTALWSVSWVEPCWELRDVTKLITPLIRVMAVSKVTLYLLFSALHLLSAFYLSV